MSVHVVIICGNTKPIKMSTLLSLGTGRNFYIVSVASDDAASAVMQSCIQLFFNYC